MRRSLTLPLLLALAASALAAPVTLNVSEDGWTASAASTYPSTTQGTPAQNGKIRLANVPEGAKIYAFNLKSNLAVVGTAADLVRTTIGRESATHVAKVTVNVTDAPGESGMPYTRAASVDLTDGERTQTAISEAGTATFAWVRIGEATISVKSRGNDNKVRTAKQKVTLDRDGLADFVVPVTDDAVAVASGTAGTRPGTAPAPTTTGGNAIGNILSTLIGLAVVGGLAFAAWRYARANPDKVSDALTKIGADVPKPLDPDPPATTTSATPAPAATPSGPIILDPVSEPIQIASAPISVSSAATGVPKLIGSDGSAFELPEGETVVGREALGGLMISHETVSRRHARLIRSGSSINVEDLGSTNGTWVNNSPAPASLNGGDTVRFGQVSYRYEA